MSFNRRQWFKAHRCKRNAFGIYAKIRAPRKNVNIRYSFAFISTTCFELHNDRRTDIPEDPKRLTRKSPIEANGCLVDEPLHKLRRAIYVIGKVSMHVLLTENTTYHFAAASKKPSVAHMARVRHRGIQKRPAFRQGKRFGHEITLYLVCGELKDFDDFAGITMRLSGYYNSGIRNTVVDHYEFSRAAKTVKDYCKTNQRAAVMSAVERALGIKMPR
jgi:hypothetical protein